MADPRIKLAPSILAADFARLGELVKQVEPLADRIHADVMDGQFVPNITLGPVVVAALRRVTRLPIETHLMIDEPERMLDAFAEAGSTSLLVHQEGAHNLHRTLARIRELGLKAGVVINPATPASLLEEVLGDVDLVLVMTVNPGFGGQKFIESTLSKIRRVREMIDRSSSACELEVDGGIDLSTAPRVVAAGANVLVAGSAIFGQRDPAAAMRQLAAAASAAGT